MRIFTGIMKSAPRMWMVSSVRTEGGRIKASRDVELVFEWNDMR